MRRRCGAAGVGAFVLLATVYGLSSTARAEVAAEVDWAGRYVRTLIVSRVSVDQVSIWTAAARPGYVPLNPTGDLNRDLWPVIAEDVTNGRHPWVIWSRYNGLDYDLAWSRWTDDGWEEVRWLQEAYFIGNDVDPDVDLDFEGRPYVAWWSDESGRGQVFFSVFLGSRWMDRYLVSDIGIDSRYPTIRANDDGSITIDYETPSGVESRTLLQNDGVSINDDADPVGTYSLQETLSR